MKSICDFAPENSIRSFFEAWVSLQQTIEGLSEDDRALLCLLDAEIVLGDAICSATPTDLEDIAMQMAVKYVNGMECDCRQVSTVTQN